MPLLTPTLRSPSSRPQEETKVDGAHDPAVATVMTAQIAEGIFRLARQDTNDSHASNAYLLIDGDEAVLLDPGSVRHFKQFYRKLTELVPLKRISYVVLHDADPDSCACVPLLERKGSVFTVITSRQTQRQLSSLGVISPCYVVDVDDEVKLKSGRKLTFVPTPYLGTAGCIATYDISSGTLFSGDLFSAVGGEASKVGEAEAAVGADAGVASEDAMTVTEADHLTSVTRFHQELMPSRDIVRTVLATMANLSITAIAPQYGPTIRTNAIDYINHIRDTECGALLDPVREKLQRSQVYGIVCSLILQRFASLFGKKEVVDVASQMDMVIDDDLRVLSSELPGDTLWSLLFEKVMAAKGISWLVLIEPFMQELVNAYNLPVPDVYKTALYKALQQTAILQHKNQQLMLTTERLSNQPSTDVNTEESTVTGLPGENDLFRHLKEELDGAAALDEQDDNKDVALIVVRLDELDEFRYFHGQTETAVLLRTVAHILEGLTEGAAVNFALRDQSFACFLPVATQADAVDVAEKVRNAIAESSSFLQRMTASLGVAVRSELSRLQIDHHQPGEFLYDVAAMRAAQATRMGGNIVISCTVCIGITPEVMHQTKTVLLVGIDTVTSEVIVDALGAENAEILIATDGNEALQIARTRPVTHIVTDIMLRKRDGFQLREALLQDSSTKNIVFIVVSSLKNETSLAQAIGLGITYYLKAPIMLSELIGIIKNTPKTLR